MQVSFLVGLRTKAAVGRLVPENTCAMLGPTVQWRPVARGQVESKGGGPWQQRLAEGNVQPPRTYRFLGSVRMSSRLFILLRSFFLSEWEKAGMPKPSEENKGDRYWVTFSPFPPLRKKT